MLLHSLIKNPEVNEMKVFKELIRNLYNPINDG